MCVCVSWVDLSQKRTRNQAGRAGFEMQTEQHLPWIVGVAYSTSYPPPSHTQQHEVSQINLRWQIGFFCL